MLRAVVSSTKWSGQRSAMAATFDGSDKDPIQQAVRDALIASMVATAEARV